jgi:aryl-alcohol dehydrogenase-like predicted oxidoreductase
MHPGSAEFNAPAGDTIGCMTITRRTAIVRGAAAAMAAGLGWNPLARAADLVTRAIPGTDERLPVVGIGTNRYEVGTPERNAVLRETLRVFGELGGQVIDTAPIYRSSETILGRLIADLGLRSRLFVATKSERKDRDGTLQRMEQSLEKLQTPKLDLIQSHNMNGAEDSLPLMRAWQEAKRVRYVGITTSRNAQFPRMLELMESQRLDFIQVNYSLADREAAERILPLAADKGIAVLINIPFGRGEIFGQIRGQALPDWAADFDCASWAQFFLKYVVSHPAVTCVIPGTTKPEHARDNFGAALGRLPDAAQRRRQEAWFDAL